MIFSKRALAGLSGTVLAASTLMIVGASPASAATPTGGCWVYSPTTPSNIEDTTPASNTSSSLAPWADTAEAPAGPADYTLTSSGSTVVGGTRSFTLVFNKGPKNGGPPASGTVYYYFSVNGTNLPVISKAFSAPGGASIPGDTINGSYTITGAGANNLVLRKVYYDIPSFLTRVACNGQTAGVPGGTNPATTPVNTNIATTFTASGPTATIDSVGNQVVTTHARKNDVIAFSVTNFADGTGTASLCDSAGTNCDAGTSSVTISGGAGSGTLSAGAAPTTGSRALKVVSGGDTSLTPITILGTPTISTNVVGGGAGTVVTVTGTNWDPNQTVSVSSTQSGPPFPPPATGDAAVTATADAAGNISTTFTVNDPTTAYIGGSRTHAAGPPPTVIFASTAFAFSGDTCTAKVGLAASGNCKLLETVDLTITAGDLKMAKASGNVTMSPITLNGTAQNSTGALKNVTVKDYRGGVLGWSLVARFSGLTGPVAPTSGNFTIPSTSLSWTPSCAPDANNDDTVTTGSAGAVFTTATTDVPVCAVSGVANYGLDLTSGGDTLVTSPLSLAIPANQAAGAYTGTIQFTLS